jgi:hypothetical protein
MTEQERAELNEVLDEAFQRWWFPVDSAVMAEREACALMVEKLGAEGYGTLAIAAMIRKGGE